MNYFFRCDEPTADVSFRSRGTEKLNIRLETNETKIQIKFNLNSHSNNLLDGLDTGMNMDL